MPPADDADRPHALQGDLSAGGLRCALIVSTFNETVTGRLLERALITLREQGADPGQLTVVRVPGAVELPLTAKRLALTGRFDVIICLGAVIRGETSHYDLVCDIAARGINQASMETGVPVIFGVVTAETMEQALERARPGPRDRGRAAALAAIEMATLFRRLKA
ncbi:MAG TPA: 6,7-dimethyl-8-ribityllumazine synthase [Nitrospiria bacterium]|nr:6,7-dimethyl-8-ribityllumazine synthase [Nitrospiria bacterium]